MNKLFFVPWGVDWLWSLPLIVLTVLLHTFVLRLANKGARSVLKMDAKTRFPHIVSLIAVGGPALCATAAHGFEAWLWAFAYFFSGAISDPKACMEFSLGAMTTFGPNGIRLGPRWEVMGPLEALSGWILFGLTTAFLFTIIREVWAEDRWT